MRGAKIIYPQYSVAKRQSQLIQQGIDDERIQRDIDNGFLNTRPKTYFPDFGQFHGVTHVVLLSPRTDTSELPNCIQDSTYGPPKVVVLSHISTLGTYEAKLLKRYQETHFLCMRRSCSDVDGSPVDELAAGLRRHACCAGGDRHAPVDDERAAHGVDHLATLQPRRADGAADGAHRLGAGRAHGARRSSQDALQVSPHASRASILLS